MNPCMSWGGVRNGPPIPTCIHPENHRKRVGHNHVTRDIKPRGQCPACDEYHERRER